MAVERIILAEASIQLRDVGYWALRKEGYQPIAFPEWAAVQAELESYVAELVDRLRRGTVVVGSQLDGGGSFCDFRAICRVRQVRQAGKHHNRAVPPELSVGQTRRGRKRREAGVEPGEADAGESLPEGSSV
jgi:hypothetical protein